MKWLELTATSWTATRVRIIAVAVTVVVCAVAVLGIVSSRATSSQPDYVKLVKGGAATIKSTHFHMSGSLAYAGQS